MTVAVSVSDDMRSDIAACSEAYERIRAILAHSMKRADQSPVLKEELLGSLDDIVSLQKLIKKMTELEKGFYSLIDRQVENLAVNEGEESVVKSVALRVVQGSDSPEGQRRRSADFTTHFGDAEDAWGISRSVIVATPQPVHFLDIEEVLQKTRGDV